LSTLNVYLGNLHASGLFHKFIESSKDTDFPLGVSKANIDDLINAKLIRRDVPWEVSKPVNTFKREY